MPKVSQEHMDGRRRQILAAAGRCFASVGFHTTTMQDVIKASGLSAGAIYNHFSSKEEIIAAIADERHAREAALCRAAEAEADPQFAIQLLARAFFEHLSDEGQEEERRVGVQLWAETLNNRKLLRMAKDGTAEPYRVLCRLIDRMKASGDLPDDLDSGAAARVMIALFQGLVLQKCRDKDLDLKAYMRVVLLLWEGLRSKRKAARRK
jgi:AcrR family transcriptional regulator